MRSLCLSIILILLLLLAPPPVQANDTIGRVGAGGIELLKSDSIAMVDEVLEISTKSIRVHYRFRNESTEDIQTTVAFPMPPYGWKAGQAAGEVNIGPLKGFRLWVNGQAVPVQPHRAAMLGDRDITGQLRQIGLSDEQIFDTFGGCHQDGNPSVICEISGEQRDEIAKIGGMDSECPAWKVAETAYWEQLFPAGKDVEIEHEYPPFVGGSYSIPYQRRHGYTAGNDIPTTSRYSKDEACLNDDGRQAILRRVHEQAQSGAGWVMVDLHDVEYILGTGRNWKGPIRNFTLRLRKESPDQVVSLCFPGQAKRLDPLTLEFSQKDFTPPDRLVVYFYSVEGKAE